MRILVASNYFADHIGGIETVAQGLVLHYRRRGHSVVWIAADTTDPRHRGHTDDRGLRAWNVTEERFGFPYPLPHPRDLSIATRLVTGCDAVHIHDCLYVSSIGCAWAARRARVPVLLTQHVAEIPYRDRPRRWLQSMAYRSVGKALLAASEQVAFVSPEVHAAMSAITGFRRPPVIVENGVDLDLFAPSPDLDRCRVREAYGAADGRPLVLFVGRFVTKKGLPLIRAAASRTPEWRWVLIGRADDEDPRSWNLGNVVVCRPISHRSLAAVYTAADVLLLPSTGEGFPVAAQEAMACGTPAVVSEATARAARDLAPFLRPTALDPESTVETVRSAIADARASDFRARVRRAAVERWDAEKVGDRYLGLLQDICADA